MAGDRLGASTAFATPRRLAAHISQRAGRAAADKRGRQKLMPVAVGLDADGSADAGAAEEAGRRWAPTPASCRRAASASADGKAEALFFDSVVPRRHAGRGPAERAGRGDRQAAHPQGDAATSCADGWTSVNFVRPAHGLVALHGADVVPVSRARPAGRPRTRTATASRPRVDPVVLQRRRPLRAPAARARAR
ncbi:MAG: glycine--tRNA ligase subunit beta [Comamonadaceae bacterium]|nr:glycine--tRNA ligase subunit beta [Comamonadaceae bacterium]